MDPNIKINKAKMNKEKQLKWIDDILTEIYKYKKSKYPGTQLGICEIAKEIYWKYIEEYEKFFTAFTERGKNHNIIKDEMSFWWYDRKMKISNSKWYKPRIKFLTEWKQDLINY